MKTMDRKRLINNSIDLINTILTEYCPPLEGDKTIQIGCSFTKYGEIKPYRNVMYTLGGCNPIKDTEVVSFDDEVKLLLAFRKLIIDEDPEIITGYNILGFDTPWLWKRAKELN